MVGGWVGGGWVRDNTGGWVGVFAVSVGWLAGCAGGSAGGACRHVFLLSQVD